MREGEREEGRHHTTTSERKSRIPQDGGIGSDTTCLRSETCEIKTPETQTTKDQMSLRQDHLRLGTKLYVANLGSGPGCKRS